jgi:alpha/beta superfamily hydrolase
MAGFKFFAELASYLNGRGIAVLRIDDRGVGKTTGIYQQATTEDFAQDIEAGIDF